jgi:hypothetical protein
VAWWIPDVTVVKDGVKITCHEQRSAVCREVGGEDIFVESGPLVGLRWPVDPDDAKWAVIQLKVYAQDATASDARVSDLDWAAELLTWSEDKDDPLRLSGPRHVKGPHAGPDSARPCHAMQNVSWC